MDEITIPDDLSTLNASELRALRDQIDEAGRTTVAAANEAEGAERDALVKTVESLKAAKEKVDAAITEAEAKEAEVQAALDSAAATFGGDDDGEGEGDDADGDDTDAEGEDDAETADETADDAEAVAASGTFTIPKRQKREVPVATDPKPKARKLFTSNGGKTDSLMDLASMFSRAMKAAQQNGDGMARVAKFMRAGHVAEDQFVSPRNSAMVNAAIMLGAKPDDDFIAAAGGFCGPGEIVTDIPQCGRTDRPVGGRLGVFRARGKYQYTRPIGIEEVATGLDYWTEAMDIAAATDPEVRKPCYPFECQDFIEAVPVAIPLCFEYGTFAEWSFPEQVASQLARFDVALARHSEALVLQRIHEQSLRYTYTPPVGESTQNALIRLVGQLLALAGYNGRNDLSGYTVVVPDALILQIIVDAKIKAWVGPTLTRAQILASLEDAFGIEVISTPDVRALAPAPVEPYGVVEGGTAEAVPCFHTSHEILLLNFDSFKHSVDDVDIAVQTDIATAKANNKHVFMETIETTEKLGCEPAFSVLMDNLVQTGSQPDLVEADDAYCAPDIPAAYGAWPGTDLVTP